MPQQAGSCAGAHSPAAAQQHRNADSHDHADRDAGTHEAAEAGKQSEPVAAVERAVVIGQDQMRQSEHERTDKCDLESDEDVLGAGPEELEHRGRRRGEPRSYAGSPHDDPQEHRGRQMQCDCENLVRQIAQAEHRPDSPVRKDRQCHPMTEVGAMDATRPSGRHHGRRGDTAASTSFPRASEGFVALVRPRAPGRAVSVSHATAEPARCTKPTGACNLPLPEADTHVSSTSEATQWHSPSSRDARSARRR
jgi:hypothetical protein